MSIADTITSIETHIGDAYDTLELGGADLTNVNKNIQNITPQLKARYLDFMNNGTDTVWNNWEKVIGAGTNVNLNNTVEAPMNNSISGNSIQNGTPSPTNEVPIQSVGDNENLFDQEIENGTINSSGNNASSDENMRTKDFLEVKETTTYTINSSTQCTIAIRYYDSTKTFLSSGTTATTPNTFTTPADCKYVRFVFVNIRDLTIKVKLEQGSQVTPYSPYNMGAISIEKCNKNLFDGANPVYVANKILNDSGVETADSTGGYTKMYISVEPNTTYTISGMSEYGPKRIYYFNKSKLFISRTDRFGTTYNTFTTPSNCYYVDFQYFIGGNDFTDYQLELGSTPTTYVAHQSTTYPIYTQAPMRSIGEVRDDFAKIGGVWYERHKIGRVVLDGTQSISKSNDNDNYSSFFYSNENIKPNSVCMSDRFKYENIGYILVPQRTGVSIHQTLGRLYLSVETSVASTATAFKNWLSTNNTEVIYELAEPTLTECTSEQVAQLEQISQAKSYEEQTNIYSNDVVVPYFDCVALKNI